MAKRIIVWTHTAQKQRRSILEYWAVKNRSTLYSEKLIWLISEQTILISKNPTVFRLTDFKDIRVSSLGHFGIFYKYNESQLIVVAFWDNRQDPQKLLDFLQ